MKKPFAILCKRALQLGGRDIVVGRFGLGLGFNQLRNPCLNHQGAFLNQFHALGIIDERCIAGDGCNAQAKTGADIIERRLVACSAVNPSSASALRLNAAQR